MKALNLVEFEVVSKAIGNITNKLGITNDVLGDLLELSATGVTLYLSGNATSLYRNIAKHDVLVELVVMYRALASVLPDDEQTRSWFHGQNTALGGVPVELIRSRSGLRDVVGYLEAQL